LKGPKSFSVFDRPRRPEEFLSGRLFIDVGGLAASFNQRQKMRTDQKAKHVARQIDWDWQKHDDLMRSIQEIINGKPVPPLSGSKQPMGENDYE
jgi:hypothetical protein